MSARARLCPGGRLAAAAISSLLLAAAAGCGASSGAGSKVGPAGDEPAARPANGPIAFERYAHAEEDERSAQIYLRAPGGALRRLTAVAGGAFGPAWAPGGGRIAFQHGTFGHQAAIYTMRADGTDQRPLSTGCTAAARCLADVTPSWSPDGRLVGFQRVYGPLEHHYDPETHGNADVARRVDLMVVDARGGAPRAIRSWGRDPQPWDGAPRWSPDGGHIVVPIGTLTRPNGHTIVATALFVMDADGRSERRITPWPLGAASPSWSPDGRTIAFNSEGGHSPAIYTVAPDGTRLRRVLAGYHQHRHIGVVWAPDWSPDGRRITFAGETDPCSSVHIGGCDNFAFTFDLYDMAADGTGVRRLTRAPQDEARPAWGRAR